MFKVLQVASIVLAAIGMGLSLAHALEYPGKRRLDRDTYLAVQAIYYPGFTIGGVFGEVRRDVRDLPRPAVHAVRQARRSG